MIARKGSVVLVRLLGGLYGYFCHHASMGLSGLNYGMCAGQYAMIKIAIKVLPDCDCYTTAMPHDKIDKRDHDR